MLTTEFAFAYSTISVNASVHQKVARGRPMMEMMMSTQTVPIALPRQVAGDWTVLPAWLPVEGMGGVLVNSFLLKGAEPVLVDTGLGALGQAFIEGLASEIDLDDLRWIWLSHTDPDHVGNLARVLDAAPNARVVTNFLGRGKMQLAGFDISRVEVLSPGDVFEAGGRRLIPVRPPYYDAPETMGFFDAAGRVFFAVDAFGALLPDPADDVAAVAEESLRDGLVGWSTIDAPWLAGMDRERLGAMLAALDRLDPGTVLSGHLPVTGGVSRLIDVVAEAYAGGTMGGLDPLAIEQVEATLA